MTLLEVLSKGFRLTERRMGQTEYGPVVLGESIVGIGLTRSKLEALGFTKQQLDRAVRDGLIEKRSVRMNSASKTAEAFYMIKAGKK